MNISAIWLAPLAYMYGIGVHIRNYLFDIGYTRSFNYDIMVIAVGNLSTGGTGKSPMTEYLIRQLHNKYSLATLSRGYKRKTKGFLIADDYSGIQEIGDEPFQMYLKYKKVAKISVGEERSIAIPNILLEHPETQVVLMDDGFQHRTVKPDFSILLTDYNKLFINDHLLPWGRLRESKKEAKRANAIIVTKCPIGISEAEAAGLTVKISEYSADDIPVFFTHIIYKQVNSLLRSKEAPTRVVAFAGLANTDTFTQYIEENFDLVEMISFKDHHYYSAEEISELAMKARLEGASLITTEKDVVKFREKNRAKLLGDVSLFYLPIEHKFIKDGNVFDELIEDAITEKYTEQE